MNGDIDIVINIDIDIVFDIDDTYEMILTDLTTCVAGTHI